MAQFDVHRNAGRNRVAVPYVVVVQSARLDGLPTRVVIPLVIPSQPYQRDPRLAPSFWVERREVVAHAWETQTIPRIALGSLLASLADDASAGAIVGATDAVIGRGRG